MGPSKPKERMNVREYTPSTKCDIEKKRCPYKIARCFGRHSLSRSSGFYKMQLHGFVYTKDERLKIPLGKQYVFNEKCVIPLEVATSFRRGGFLFVISHPFMAVTPSHFVEK